MRVVLTVSMTAMLGLLSLLQGCAATVPTSPPPCPATLGEYKAGEATADDVKRCLGKPANEDRNSDGRFVYQYPTKDGKIVAFLFDPSGKLIKTLGYTTK